jgi:hypothetical protein
MKRTTMNLNSSSSGVRKVHASSPVSLLDETYGRSNGAFRRSPSMALALYLALLSPAQSQELNLVKNPSFELGPVDWILVGNAGWHVRDFQDPARTGDAEAYVNIALGSVRQDIATTPGTLYHVSFWMAANGFSSFANMSASFGGVTGFTQSYGPGAFGYQEHTFVVKATETVSTFVFAGVMSGGTFFIDDVSVTLISPFPTITTESLPDARSGKMFEQQLLSSGGLPPFTWTSVAGALPDGIALTTGGLLSGTPNTTGVYSFTVRVMASDGMQSEKSFQLPILPPPVCVPPPSGGIAWWGFDEMAGLLAPILEAMSTARRLSTA